MKTKSSNSGAWILILFGLAFLIPGLWLGYATSQTALKISTTKGWPTTEATIHSAKLKPIRDSDGNMYRAEADYSYVWDGQTYRSDVLSFQTGTDSNLDYHAKRVKLLKSHKSSGRPMTAYVNPDNPNEAILFNKIRWSEFSIFMTMGAVFSFIGGGILWLTYYAAGLSKREDRRRMEHPNRPWMWRDEWQSPTIKSNQKLGFIFVIFFTLIWCGISIPTTFVIYDEIVKNGNKLALIGLFAPIVGIGLIIWTFSYFLQWRRFKDNKFTLETYPAGLGYSLKGYFSIKANLPDDTVFTVTLSSVRKYYTGSGDNRNPCEEILWQDAQNIPYISGKFGADYRLPVFFELPQTGQPSNNKDSDNIYLWRLSLKSKLAGADLDQHYEVPVYDPADYKFKLPIKQLSNNSHRGVYVDEGDWQNTGVVYTKSVGSEQYYFPPARNKSIAFTFTFIALFFGGVAMMRRWVDDVPLSIVVVFGLLALFLTYMALHFWLYKSSIETSRNHLTLGRGMFWRKYTDFTPEDIQSLSLDSTLSSGPEKYYNIKAQLKSGKAVTLAHNMRGKRDIQSLIEKIKQDLGLIGN